MLVRRSKVREMALQVLFLWDAHAADDQSMAARVVADGTEDPPEREGALEMARAAWQQRATSDAWVARVAPKWPPHRQPAVDRNVLRLAVWELINSTTPAKVVIDEAIELVKHYSTEQSAAFVNGVLDAILREHRTITGSALPPTPPASEVPPPTE